MVFYDFQEIINAAKDTVTITAVTVTGYNSRGDADTTETDYSVDCCIQIMSGREEEVVEGLLQAGDAIGFFHPDDESLIVNGNIVTFNGHKYVIKDVFKEHVGSDDIFIEAHMRRIE